MALLYPIIGSQIVTTQASKSGTSFGPELLIQLREGRRRAQLEERLRELVREGVLPAGTRLPSSRALAGDLMVSRRLVVDAYAQLHAEGYLSHVRVRAPMSPRRAPSPTAFPPRPRSRG